jgi:hypothetical protein
MTHKYITFGAKRKAETAANNWWNYNQDTYVLSNPHVVALHFTAGSTWTSAWNTFNDDMKYMSTPSHLEYPGVSALHRRQGRHHHPARAHDLRTRHAIGIEIV